MQWKLFALCSFGQISIYVSIFLIYVYFVKRIGLFIIILNVTIFKFIKLIFHNSTIYNPQKRFLKITIKYV